MINHVYAYCRVSGKKQIDGHGLERQLDSIRKFCRRQKLQILKTFNEQVSGTKDESERLEFSKMITDILSNGINTIVVVISANTGENITRAISEDPMKKALIQMQGIFAELDKSMLIKRLHKARLKVKKEKGRCEGQKPYGATPQEAEILKRVRYMRRSSKYQSGMTYQAIADKLNEEGITTKRGRQWTPVLVYNILKRNRKFKRTRPPQPKHRHRRRTI
jgi:DNA invertase Pin-like site-specific DNA recombinase